MSRTAVTTTSVGDIKPLQRDFERSQRAARRSPRTIETYREGIDQLTAFLARHGMPLRAASIRREHVEAFMDELNARTKPATASNRFRALQQFFKFLVEEGEIERSPMERMRRPAVPVEPVPVLSSDDLRALLAACNGKSFEERRDTAIIRLFVDTGMRRAELLGLRVADVDFDQDVAVVLGKGGRPRACPFGNKTGLALSRYVRLRGGHPSAAEEALWLGKRGPLTETGLTQMLWRRSEQAGSRRSTPTGPPHVRPHLAGPGRERGRPGAAHRLDRARHAGPLRRVHGRRAGPRSPPPPEPRRPRVVTLIGAGPAAPWPTSRPTG